MRNRQEEKAYKVHSILEDNKNFATSIRRSHSTQTNISHRNFILSPNKRGKDHSHITMHRHFFYICAFTISVLAAPLNGPRQVNSSSSEENLANTLSTSTKDDGSWFRGKYEGEGTSYNDGQPSVDRNDNDLKNVDGSKDSPSTPESDPNCWVKFGPFALNICDSSLSNAN